MNKIAKVGLGVVALVAAGVVAIYVDAKMGLKADQEACPTVKTEDAINAVVHDVLRPENRMFSKYNLATGDVSVESAGVQIGPSSTLVPFHITKEPGTQFFGMSRCSVLSNVEYGSD